MIHPGSRPLVDDLSARELALLDTFAITRCQLIPKISRRLNRQGYLTLGAAARVPAGRLYAIRGLGEHRVNAVRERILVKLGRPCLTGVSVSRLKHDRVGNVLANRNANRLPTALRQMLDHCPVKTLALTSDAHALLARLALTSLGDVARTPRPMLAALLSEDAITLLAGEIAAAQTALAKRRQAYALSAHAYPGVAEWIAQGSALRIKPRPVLALTMPMRVLLATYPCQASTEYGFPDLSDLIKPGIVTLADLCDRDMLDVLAIGYYGERRLDRLRDKLIALVVTGRHYVPQPARHPAPAALLRALRPIGLEHLTMPAEARETLIAMKIETLADLARTDPDALHAIEGHRSWMREARRMISLIYLTLRPDPLGPDDADRYAITQTWLDPRITANPVPRERFLPVLPEIRTGLAKIGLDALIGLTPFQKSALTQSGITDLLALADAEPRQLLEVHGFGARRLARLRESLAVAIETESTRIQRARERDRDADEWDALGAARHVRDLASRVPA